MKNIVMYSVSGCSRCGAFETIFTERNIQYKKINDPEALLNFADDHAIATIPAFDVDGVPMDYLSVLNILGVSEKRFDEIQETLNKWIVV